MDRKLQSGFTLLEFLIASIMGLVVLAAVIYGIGKMFKDTSALMADYAAETELYQLNDQILKTGRMADGGLANPGPLDPAPADGCRRVEVTAAAATPSNPQSIAIECWVKPYTDQPPNRYRFRRFTAAANQPIQFETYNGTNWIVSQTFGAAGKLTVTGFRVCSILEILAGAPNCPIVNGDIKRALNHSGYKTRYFRYEIQATHPNGKRTYDIKSGFYVRNSGVATTQYLWGAK